MTPALFLLLAPQLAARADERVEVGPLLGAPERLVAYLVLHDADVRAASQRLAAAHADVAQAGVFPNPQLVLEAGTIALPETNPPGLGFSDTTHVSFGLGETFELGKRGPRLRAAQHRRDAAREDVVAAIDKRTAEVRLILGRVAYLSAKQAALETNLQAETQLVDLEKRRVDAGDLAEAEWQRIVLDAETVGLEVERSRVELAATLADCRAALVAACAADGLGVDALAAGAPVPDAIADAEGVLAARPDLRALHLSSASARDDATLFRRRAIPDPTVSLVYTHDNLTLAGNQPNALTLDVSLPLPIFDTGAHDAAKAEAHARELDAQAEALARAARADLAGLTARRRSLKDAIARLDGDAIPRSTKVLAATRKAFDTGHVSLADLILVERNHRALVILLLDTRFELFQSETQLRQALGLDGALARGAS